MKNRGCEEGEGVSEEGNLIIYSISNKNYMVHILTHPSTVNVSFFYLPLFLRYDVLLFQFLTSECMV
jgi:hypothetical protein